MSTSAFFLLQKAHDRTSLLSINYFFFDEIKISSIMPYSRASLEVIQKSRSPSLETWLYDLLE
jgi:hypothetical protein